MSEYLLDKFAGMLSEEDTNQLFTLLKKRLSNNRSATARKCHVTDKATYDWENTAFIKLGTKMKVLAASLDCNYLETLQYLLSRSKESSTDLLKTTLGTLYANALESITVETFTQEYTTFLKIMQEHLGLIRDTLDDEVSDMISTLRAKANDYGMQVQVKSLREYSPEEIVDSIKIIGQIYLENPSNAEAVANQELCLPPNAMTSIIETFRNLCVAKKAKTITTDSLHRDESIINYTNVMDEAEDAHSIIPYRPHFSSDVWFRLAFARQNKGEKQNEITTTA